MRVFVLFAPALFVSCFMSQVLHAWHRERAWLIASILALGVKVVVGSALVPTLGAVGAGLAVGASILTSLGVMGSALLGVSDSERLAGPPGLVAACPVFQRRVVR
jgi:O-antigen/teichoic acid export membrane protein